MKLARLARSVAELRSRIKEARRNGASVALVPTMGALHEGHLSLIRLAAARAEFVAASIFVNPTQFSADEDFAAYPRAEERDVTLLSEAGCDLVYAPDPATMYPTGFATTVTVAGLTADLEGAVRPHHFAGVATVVAKLLIQAGPDVAVFGEKDYQQLQIVRRLTADLDLPVEICAGPIVRDHDGLALSSRNAYLTVEQRRIATALHRALVRASDGLLAGAHAADAESEATAALLAAGFASVDYFEARDADSLARLGPGPVAPKDRLLAAARLGRVRLIDNLAV
jgi:pantoate--beta-alanine ligase